MGKPASQQQSTARRRQVSSRHTRDDDSDDEDFKYQHKYQPFRTYQRSHHHHNSDYYDDDTPSWPMYPGICLWIIMGITLIMVWYDEKYGLWDEIPGDIPQEEAVVQVNDDMMRPDF